MMCTHSINKWFLLILAGVLSTHHAAWAEANKKAHVHGAAKLTLALESATQGTIDLDVPADSIYGFEHKATSKQDKEAQEKGLKKLRDNPASLVRMPAGCTVKTVKVGLEAEEHEEGPKEAGEHHGEHADVNASYSVACASTLKGAKVTIALFELFPKIKGVSFQVLSPTGQTESKVQNSHDSIILP
ncbi:MAG: ZrgA family zinc uptake protein [Bdellovibrionota bacterium]